MPPLRLRFFPRTGARPDLKIVGPGPEAPGQEKPPPASPQKMQVLRRWIEYDSDVAKPGIRQRANWDTILGIALIVGISVIFWIGAALLVVHFLR